MKKTLQFGMIIATALVMGLTGCANPATTEAAYHGIPGGADAPTEVNAGVVYTGGIGGVLVTWKGSADAKEYTVYRHVVTPAYTNADGDEFDEEQGNGIIAGTATPAANFNPETNTYFYVDNDASLVDGTYTYSVFAKDRQDFVSDVVFAEDANGETILVTVARQAKGILASAPIAKTALTLINTNDQTGAAADQLTVTLSDLQLGFSYKVDLFSSTTPTANPEVLQAVLKTSFIINTVDIKEVDLINKTFSKTIPISVAGGLTNIPIPGVSGTNIVNIYAITTTTAPDGYSVVDTANTGITGNFAVAGSGMSLPAANQTRAGQTY